MKTKTQKIYIAEDGKEFIDKTECEKYEVKLKEDEKTVTFWQIVNQPDLTEGRGYYGLIYAKVKVGEHDSPIIFLQDYCVRTFGRPIAFVQGNWKKRLKLLKIKDKFWVQNPAQPTLIRTIQVLPWTDFNFPKQEKILSDTKK
jgi:hypothetical protein